MKDSQIVILHGWTSSQETKSKWQPLIKLLQSRGYSVLFLQLPGLSQPLATSWNLDQYVAWVNDQVEKTTPAIIVGHSFGGQLAIKLTALHPEKVKNLILIDSSGVPDHRWHKRLKRLVFICLAKLGKQLPFKKTLRAWLYLLAHERDYYQATELQKVTMKQAIRQDIRWYASRVVVPTLVIWGANDQITPLFMGKSINSLIPQSKLSVIPQARHSPQYTHPVKVAELIDSWLRLTNQTKRIS